MTDSIPAFALRGIVCFHIRCILILLLKWNFSDCSLCFCFGLSFVSICLVFQDDSSFGYFGLFFYSGLVKDNPNIEIYLVVRLVLSLKFQNCSSRYLNNRRPYLNFEYVEPGRNNLSKPVGLIVFKSNGQNFILILT